MFKLSQTLNFCHFNVAAVHNSVGWENKESGSGLKNLGDGTIQSFLYFFKANSYYIQNSGTV